MILNRGTYGLKPTSVMLRGLLGCGRVKLPEVVMVVAVVVYWGWCVAAKAVLAWWLSASQRSFITNPLTTRQSERQIPG